VLNIYCIAFHHFADFKAVKRYVLMWHICALSFIHFRARFTSGKDRGVAALGGLEIPHGQQRFQIVLLAPHEDRT